jgi:hypothetical protein
MSLIPTVKNTNDIYWSVNGIPTYSKASALLSAQGDQSKINFHFMENTWDHADFSKEPNMSWNQLCKIRAQQLRDQYSHLCLWFSGGYDSWHILNVFIDANCVIDELLICDRREHLLESWPGEDDEITIAFRLAEQYKKNHNSKCKITRINTGFEYHKHYWNKHAQGLTGGIGSNVRFSRTHATTIFHEHPECATYHKDSIGNITGFETAKLDLYNGVWYTWTFDIPMAAVSNSNLIMFYIDDDFPELHVKQVHMAMQFFENHNLATSEWVHAVQGNKKFDGSEEIFKKYRTLGQGRLTPISSSAVHKLARFRTTEDTQSFDSKKLIEYFKQNNMQAYHRYSQGLMDLKDGLQTWDPQKDKWGVLPSKKYLVRSVARPQI